PFRRSEKLLALHQQSARQPQTARSIREVWVCRRARRSRRGSTMILLLYLVVFLGVFAYSQSSVFSDANEILRRALVWIAFAGALTILHLALGVVLTRRRHSCYQPHSWR